MIKKNPDKATMRDFLNAVISNKVDDEVVDFAKAEIARMDERNAKRAEKPSKTAIENEPIKMAIVGVLTNEPKTASAIGTEVGVTTQKASALLRQLVDNNKAVSTEIKVTGKGKCKGYTLAPTE